MFDSEFYIMGQVNNKIHFQGMQASHIFLDDEGQWRLESYGDPDKYAFISKKVKC